MPGARNFTQDSDLLRAVLDIVIPRREDGMLPSAGALGLDAPVADGLRRDDRYGPSVEAGLAALQEAAVRRHPDGFLALGPDEQLAVFESQLEDHPALVRGITRHLYLPYYQHPTVLAGLGQPARPPFPEGFEVEETDPELLELLEPRRIGPPDAED